MEYINTVQLEELGHTALVSLRINEVNAFNLSYIPSVHLTLIASTVFKFITCYKYCGDLYFKSNVVAHYCENDFSIITL